MLKKQIKEFVLALSENLAASPRNENIDKTLASARKFLADDSINWQPQCTPTMTPVTKWLNESLNIELPENIGRSTKKVFTVCKKILPYCPWTPGYEKHEADEHFFNNFSYAIIIGKGGYIDCDYFSAGLTLVSPGTFYPEHYHPAIEIYINLTKDSQWSLNNSELQCKNIGDVMSHPSNIAHAMYSKDRPLIAPWFWSGDVQIPAKMCGK